MIHNWSFLPGALRVCGRGEGKGYSPALRPRTTRVTGSDSDASGFPAGPSQAFPHRGAFWPLLAWHISSETQHGSAGTRPV